MIPQLLNTSTIPGTGPLVPPRPNLGPEPLNVERTPAGLVAGMALALAVVGFLIVKNRRQRSVSNPASGDEEGGAGEGVPHSPRERLIEQAALVRKALVDSYGETWRAKTTEEIATEPDLFKTFSPALSADLLAFLREADRAKFAGGSVVDDQRWDPWLAEFLAVAGASSTIKGR